jgi:aldehyde:ferredoxin oxidoreductase
MAIKGGFMPQMIRVDLTQGTIAKEPLPSEDVLRMFIGGTGLGAYYLLTEAPLDAQPTEPRAPLYFMTGPLAGTPAPSSANWVTVCFHLSVPYAAGIGHGHGFWAARLKHAGYEGVLIYGKADRPVYLWIDDDRIELRDASAYWGLGTRETERLIKRELGDPEDISVACIGPGGEAQLPGAMVKVDRNHGAGKGSPGAIMGSKNLKAIAVRGTGRVPLANPDAFMEAVTAWQERLTSGVPISNYADLHDGGISRNYGRLLGDTYRVAFKNLTDPEGGRTYGRKWVEAAARWKVIPRPSYNCPIGCAYDVEMTDGPYAGYRVSFCGGGENTEGAAAMIGVDDPTYAMILTEHYDDMGLESGAFGSILGMLYEAYNRGWITKADTDGLDLTWGNWESALALIEKAIKREGIGATIAAGLKEAAEQLGRPRGMVDEFRAITVHVKGAGINIHDWRPSQSVLFGYIVAGSGPAHFGLGADHRPMDEAGYPTVTPGVASTFEEALQKVTAVRKTQAIKVWWDCLGICWFACGGIPKALTSTALATKYAVGWDDFTNAEALAIGERVVNALRLIYKQRGFTKRDEFDYGKRYLEPQPVGPAQGRTIEPWLPAMVDEYYRQMGWDVATGFPTPATLERLGLTDLAR